MQLRRAGVADAAKLSLIGCATFIECFANDHDGDEVVRYLASDQSPDWYARELTDPARINVYPERVSIKSVSRTATLADALKSFGVTDKRLEEHAILNGMQQKDQVTAGMLIKVVEKGSK